LKKARQHLEIAREIDPDMCDLHQQFAHVAAQQQNFPEYEEELTQAVLCGFTMQQALEMWKHYWEVAMHNAAATSPTAQMDVEERKNYYTRIIEEAVEKERRKSEEEEKPKRGVRSQ
jgi:hypothetical protein